jgi:nucleotide-binding universal stress UspA family protein
MKTRPQAPISRHGSAQPGQPELASSRQIRNGHRASCINFEPVLKANLSGATIELANILVGVDFSDESKKALAYATAFARQSGAMVTFLHVVEPIACQADFGYGPVARQIPNRELLTQAKRRLTTLTRRLGGCGFEVATAVRSGAAEVEIVRLARESNCDLIIIGTHGMCTAEDRSIGKTADRVIRGAPCPVLVVRKNEREFVHPGTRFHSRRSIKVREGKGS